MVLQPPQAAATARAITAGIVTHVRVAGGPVVDAVLTFMQPSCELAARLRHTVYATALTAHLIARAAGYVQSSIMVEV